MRCVRYNHENPDTAGTCGGCGLRLAKATPCPTGVLPSPPGRTCCLACDVELEETGTHPFMCERVDVGAETQRRVQPARFFSPSVVERIVDGDLDASCGIVGTSRAGHHTAMGDTVNATARLCERAQAGQILISEPTWDAPRDHIDADVLPPTLLKGKERPPRLFDVSEVR